MELDMLIKDRLYPLGIKDNNGIEYFLEYSPYEHPTLGFEKIMFRAGQRHVVKHLTDTYDPKGHRHGT